MKKAKKVIIFIVVVVVGVVAYNHFTGGSSGSALSPDERELARLTDDFRRVRRQFNEANSGAAIGGIDMSDEIDIAFSEIARIESALRALKGRLSSESAIEKAERLQNNIAVFKRSLTG